MFLRSVNRILRIAILYTMETSLVTAYVFRPLSIPETESEQGGLDGRSRDGDSNLILHSYRTALTAPTVRSPTQYGYF